MDGWMDGQSIFFSPVLLKNIYFMPITGICEYQISSGRLPCVRVIKQDVTMVLCQMAFCPLMIKS